MFESRRGYYFPSVANADVNADPNINSDGAGKLSASHLEIVGGTLNLTGGGTFNVDAAGNLNATTVAINGVPVPQFPTSDGEYKLVVSGGAASWVPV